MWLLLAFLTAFFTSLRDVFARMIAKKISPYVTAWAWPFFTLPLLVLMLIAEGVPALGKDFWPAVVVSTMILTISSVLFFKAIEVSDLSLCVPMLTFTPLFLLVTSPLIVGESPRFFGYVGIILIVAGSYVLNIKDRHLGFWAPFKSLIKDRGPRYILIVAFLFSIGANVDKVGVLNSSPVMWVVVVNFWVAAILTVVMLRKVPKAFEQIKGVWFVLVLIGITSSIAMVCQMNAIKMTIVPYVISIKRTSTMTTSLLGLWLFKEKDFKQRLSGVVIMVLGVLIISFFG